MNFVGKYCMCVGGTSGIGQGIARRLAFEKANVIIVGRNQEVCSTDFAHSIPTKYLQVGNAMVAEMKRTNPDGDHTFLECDVMF